jgi:hypothetical protein
MRFLLDLFFVFSCITCKGRREKTKAPLCNACQRIFLEQCISCEQIEEEGATFMTIFEHEGPAKDLYLELEHFQDNKLLLALASISLIKGKDLAPILILDLFDRGLEKKWYIALKKIWALEKGSLKKINGTCGPIMIASINNDSAQRKVDYLRKQNLDNEFLCITLTRKTISQDSV